MTIFEMSNEYKKQYDILSAKMDGLKPLLSVYTGEDLYLLRRKIKVYYDMALECRQISDILSSYYNEEGSDID